MAYASTPFTLTPNASTKQISLASGYEYLNIKDIELTIIKTGSNDCIGTGRANTSYQNANFISNNGTARKSDYTNSSCVYIQEYNGSTWVTKVLGTANLSVQGEITFSFTNYDANYYIQGIARGEI